MGNLPQWAIHISAKHGQCSCRKTKKKRSEVYIRNAWKHCRRGVLPWTDRQTTGRTTSQSDLKSRSLRAAKRDKKAPNEKLRSNVTEQVSALRFGRKDKWGLWNVKKGDSRVISVWVSSFAWYLVLFGHKSGVRARPARIASAWVLLTKILNKNRWVTLHLEKVYQVRKLG